MLCITANMGTKTGLELIIKNLIIAVAQWEWPDLQTRSRYKMAVEVRSPYQCRVHALASKSKSKCVSLPPKPRFQDAFHIVHEKDPIRRRALCTIEVVKGTLVPEGPKLIQTEKSGMRRDWLKVMQAAPQHAIPKSWREKCDESDSHMTID